MQLVTSLCAGALVGAILGVAWIPLTYHFELSTWRIDHWDGFGAPEPPPAPDYVKVTPRAAYFGLCAGMLIAPAMWFFAMVRPEMKQPLLAGLVCALLSGGLAGPTLVVWSMMTDQELFVGERTMAVMATGGSFGLLVTAIVRAAEWIGLRPMRAGV